MAELYSMYLPDFSSEKTSYEYSPDYCSKKNSTKVSLFFLNSSEVFPSTIITLGITKSIIFSSGIKPNDELIEHFLVPSSQITFMNCTEYLLF